MRSRTLLILMPLLLTVPATAHAQARLHPDSIRDDRNFTFYDRGPYNAAVPRPESVLGYDVGEWNTQFAQQEKVLLSIAAAARNRVHVEEIGTTSEKRAMRLYIVSSPENIARLDAIRADLDRLADPRGVAQAELDAIAARTPAVVWINESVHGDESPGFETAMQMLYQLAASDEPATVNALRNLIVILNPSTNPDGHERFAVWYNSIGVRSPDPRSLEKSQPWSISGRFNHYRFDMNRDVMTSTQNEVRVLVAAMLKWHPMVAVDQHGQVATYFFPPTALPLNPSLIGTNFQKWMEIYGRANAGAFDNRGWMYYARDSFDLYGPFYWDSWPSLIGAIGMTFETDGGGHRGILIRRNDGTLLSFRDGIAKHYVAAMSTIYATAERSAERVRDYVAFRQGAVDAGSKSTLRRVVIVPGTDPARAAELVATLLRSGIEVRRASNAFTSSRAHAYADDRTGSRRFDVGAYVIDMAQPHGLLAKTLLEPVPALDTAFARTQLDRFRRNQMRGANVDREGYEFYDVSAWSLPVAFGTETYWTEDATPVQGTLLQLPTVGTRVAGEVLPVEISSGVVNKMRPQSAYVFSPERSGAVRLAYQLLAEGYRVAVGMEPVEADGRRLPRGSYIVRVARNDSTLHQRIDVLARESGVEVFPVNSAFTETAQFGIGSGAVADLQKPNVAVVGGDGISQTSYGAVWWTLETRYGVKFTPIAVNALGGDISRFNVVIVPSGSLSALGKPGVDALKSWVRNGGTLITMGSASAWAASNDVDLTSARMYRPDSTAKKSPADAAATELPRDTLLAVTSPGAAPDAPAPLPGSHFDVVLDRSHWLTHGYDNARLTVLFEGSRILKLSKEGANVAVFPTEGKLLRAGFSFPDNSERLLRNSALVINEPLGSGHVVLFNNEPMFRAWWRALDKLVLNAVVLGPGM